MSKRRQLHTSMRSVRAKMGVVIVVVVVVRACKRAQEGIGWIAAGQRNQGVLPDGDSLSSWSSWRCVGWLGVELVILCGFGPLVLGALGAVLSQLPQFFVLVFRFLVQRFRELGLQFCIFHRLFLLEHF